MEPVCALRKNDRWYWNRAPLARLQLSMDDLHQLPDYLARYGATYACGVLPYECGLELHGLSNAHHKMDVFLLDGWEAGTTLPLPPSDFKLQQAFRPLQTEADYAAAFARIQQWLNAGDCYQVNLAQAFEASFSGSPYAGWWRLMQSHTAPHACYFAGKSSTVMSASPENFLSITQGIIATDPIKGTQPRGATTAEDERLGQLLLNSEKDRAENLMIVDLLRNDLGAVCVPGSITATPLFQLKRFSNVQHLVSHVEGRLRPDVSPVQALLACFPGGSITGAPKQRVLEIIQSQESTPREAYCGSFFVLDHQGNLNANLLIRTFQAQDGRLRIHGGSGITIASRCDDEYAECRFKVEKLMEALRV